MGGLASARSAILLALLMSVPTFAAADAPDPDPVVACASPDPQPCKKRAS